MLFYLPPLITAGGAFEVTGADKKFRNHRYTQMSAVSLFGRFGSEAPMDGMDSRQICNV